MLHQRICDAVFVIALSLAVLQSWQRIAAPVDMDQLLHIPDIVGYSAAATALLALSLRFVSARRTRYITGLAAYLALFATAVLLVVSTGGANSKYLSVWIVVALFAPLFGLFATVLCLATAVAFIVLQYTSGVVGAGGLVALSLAAIIPLIVGTLAWGFEDGPDAQETSEDKSYRELASELSQVAGKSEVVINAIADGVLALDSKGIIQLINPAAQQLIGWGKHDSLGLSYKSVLKIINIKNQAVGEREDPVVRAITTNKTVFTDQLSIQTQSGKNFIASISVSPVGQIGQGVIVVFRDITNEKSDERQRAEFISTASHEMRTPVASIEGYLGLALNPATAQIDGKARDFITKAHESAQHLGHLFQDLLDVSKADDGRMKNQPTIIDIIPFMYEVVAALTPKAAAKNLRITYKPMPDGPVIEELSKRLNPVYYVNVDRDHLREVCDNLLENAIKYTPQGEVVVDVGGDQSHVIVSVQDTGIGIPKEDQAHLFQKFYRVDNSDTREIGGTGLGLYLCRKLTEAMGGRIWLDSEYKKGSTFHVELPRVEHDEAQRLIEQASIVAEQQAQLDTQQAAQDTVLAQQAQAAQMSANNTFAAQPSTPPIADAIPVPPPSASATIPQPTPAPAPTITRPLPNTPLSAIETNPRGYITRQPTGNVSIPPRQQ
jgi:PAS domain S-box-containing protein